MNATNTENTIPFSSNFIWEFAFKKYDNFISNQDDKTILCIWLLTFEENLKLKFGVDLWRQETRLAQVGIQ